MVEVSDIVDRETLEAWLLDRPGDETKQFAISIAHRAAMRVLPLYWQWVETSEFAKDHDLTALPVLRCNLISGIARKMPTPEIRGALRSAANSVTIPSPLSPPITTPITTPITISITTSITVAEMVSQDAAFIADSAIATATAAYYFATAEATADGASQYAADAADTTTAQSPADLALWKQMRQDCAALQNGDMLLATPLWNGDKNPFQKEWEEVRKSLPVAPPARSEETARGALPVDWSFWINWYQDALEGREPKSWKMLEEIAGIGDGHPITKEDWKKGPERVNFLIGEIQAKHLSAYAPLAERIEFDPPLAKFRAIAQEPKNPDLLVATLSQVEDALKDALADTGNGLREESREVRVLNRTIQRYSNDPQRIEMDFTSVAIGLRRQIEQTQELPKSEGNLALLEAVEEGARAIRATHPDVAKNREILAGQVLRELSEEDIAVLKDAKDVLVAISEGVMAEDFDEDIPQLINDALTPLPNGAPPLPGMDPAVRVFGRVSRMALMMQKSGEIVEQVEKSKSFRALKIVKMGATVYGWLSSLVSIGLRLFGIL